MQNFRGFFLLNLIAIVVSASLVVDAAKFRSHRRFSQKSIQHLKKLGMLKTEIEELANNMVFKEKGNNKAALNQTKQRKCGDALRELLIYIFDRTDMEAQQMVAGQLDADKLSLFTGTVTEQEFPVETILLPIETVDDKCFAVRRKDGFPSILCAGCRNNRNKWINAIHEAVLCKKTKIQGRLPEQPGAELEAETVTLAEETKPSGINVHIADSPLGKPEIMINGMTIQQMKEAEKKHAITEVEIKPPTPSISDLAPKINDPEEPDNPSNSINQPRSQQEIDALMESSAEHNFIPADDPRVPKYGYEATKRGLNKHS